MSARKFILFLSGVIAISFICTGCFPKKEIIESESLKIDEAKAQYSNTSQTVVREKFDLYSDTPYDLPLVSIAEISQLPKKIKKIVDSLLESSQGFYYLKVDSAENVFIILQNPVAVSNTYFRHNLQFIEIDKEGKITSHIGGYIGVDGEVENAVFQNKNDVWVFDESAEPYKPIKHTAYNEKGKVKFVETWNYSEDEPIKYQMTDANKKVVSILKESQDNDANLRREHIFYDNDGNIMMSLTINYDGANVSRLTYYNSHDLIDSVSIISEFTDGHKTRELVYNEDYELIKTVEAEYLDGERKTIKVFADDGKKLMEISS